MVNTSELVPAEAKAITPRRELDTSIDALNSGLAGYLESLGLPTKDLLAPMLERRTVIERFESAIAVLPATAKEKADYLSKYCVAIATGLFDAALNFLWDETVRALRGHAAEFDLGYFFDVAEKREDHRKHLQTRDDLPRIEDSTLIDTCARIGLITEVNRERLRHVNYMRNHASAAHPNNAAINGDEMIAWLTNCLRYAITAKPDRHAVEIKRLLHSIRTQKISPIDVGAIAAALANMPQSVVDDLLYSVFGLFCDPKVGSPARENVEAIAQAVWNLATETRRFDLGSRAGEFSRHGETDRVSYATTFLTKCGGLQYRSDDLLTLELLEKVRTLRAAHVGWNNFYSEWPHAAALATSLPVGGKIPRAVLHDFVKVIGICAIGNGKGYREGVDETAYPHYQGYLERFSDREISEFLRCFEDDEFCSDLFLAKPDARARALLTRFRGRTSNLLIHKAVDALLALPVGQLGKAASATACKTAIASLPAPT